MSVHTKAVIVRDEHGTPVVGATVRLNANDACGPRMGRTNADGYVAWDNFPDAVLDSDLEVWAPGYVDYVQSLTGAWRLSPTNQNLVLGGSDTPGDVSLPALVASFPDAPSRSQVCGVRLTFQGLTVPTAQYGVLPWFDPFLAALSRPDRLAVYAAKHAAGDTHQMIGFDHGGPYDPQDGSQPYSRISNPDLEADPERFRDLVREIILEGFVPFVIFDGDDGDHPEHGYPNALRQLPILVDLLASGQDLNPYVLYGRLYDGVFYGSSPENIAGFGQAFRALLPNGYLAIEHNPGHIPCGGGPGDYAPGGRMSTYDVVLSEFENGIPRTTDLNPDTNPGASTWMVVDRLVRPFIRPDDMPTGPRWDPNPPCYLAEDSDRGPYFYCAFEWDAYRWVRGQVSADDIAANRAYLRAMGCTYTG